MNIFQRAHAGLNLSPEERAFLKLVQGFVITGLVAALGTLATVVSNGATLHDAVIATIVAFAVGVILAAAKYFSANGQAPLATVLQGVADSIEHQFEPTPLKRPISGGSNDAPPDGAA